MLASSPFRIPLNVKHNIPFLLSQRMMASRTTLHSTSDSSPYYPPRPRRFAPINTSRPNSHAAPPLKGIIFDVDGTLCLPQNYMFKEMRDALSIPKGVDILDHIRSLSDEPDSSLASRFNEGPTSELTSNNYSAEPLSMHPNPSSPQSRAVATIQQIERNAMHSQTPQPGLTQLMSYLSSHSIRKALCTRNFPAPVTHLLEKYLPKQHFWPVVTRETEGVKPKPSPEGIWWIAQQWGLDADAEQAAVDSTHAAGSREKSERDDVNGDPGFQRLLQAGLPNDADPLEVAKRYLGAGLIMVGDSIDDMAAGHRAGATTVLLVNEENEHLRGHEYTDLAVGRLDELVEVLDVGFVGRE